MEFLSFNHSFADEENRDIESAFDDELPGLLNHALDDWDSLKKQGDFTKSETSARRRKHMENLSSRTLPFIDECCELFPEAMTRKRDLYRAFQSYVERNDVTRYSTAAMFHEDLYMGADYAIENADEGKKLEENCAEKCIAKLHPTTDNDDDPQADFAKNHLICAVSAEKSL